MVISALQIVGGIECTTFQEAVAPQHRLTQGDDGIVRITADKIDISNRIYLMGQISLISTPIFIQHKSKIDKMTVWHGVCPIGDEVFVEAIVATIGEITADARTLIVEISHIKHHA